MPLDGIDWDDDAKMMLGMTCVCVVGIEDPVRDEVDFFFQFR